MAKSQLPFLSPVVDSQGKMTAPWSFIMTQLNGITAGTGNLILTHAQLISDLGYTPYNATNPAGYINSSGTAANFSGTLSGDVTGPQNATSVNAINGVNIASIGNGVLKSNGGIISIATSADFPTGIISLFGDVSGIGTVNGPTSTLLATVNPNIGSFGSASSVPVVTVNGKGLVTAVSTATIPHTVNISGDVTSVGGTTSSNAVVTLNTVNSNVGVYGSSIQVPVITVNAKGLVTRVITANIASNIAVTGGDLTMSGNVGSNITNATLNTVNSNVGVFGSTTQVPVITVNGKGLITAIANVAVVIPSGNITLIGDVTGSGTTGSNTVVTLATVNSNIGMYGSSGTVSQITVNGKGLVTSASNVAIIAGNIASSTTTINIGSATAPSPGQVLTATSSSAATWQSPTAGGGLISNNIAGATSILQDTSYVIMGYLNLSANLTLSGTLGII